MAKRALEQKENVNPEDFAISAHTDKKYKIQKLEPADSKNGEAILQGPLPENSTEKGHAHEASPYDAEAPTTVKTPKQAENGGGAKAPEHMFGMFDESIKNGKSGRAASPFSQKMFNFSGNTGLSTTYRGGAYGHPSVGHYHGFLQSGSNRCSRQTGEFDDKQAETCVNPFNTVYRPYQAPQGHREDSIFGGSARQSPSQPAGHEEEDFEIKPHNIYGHG